MTDPEKVAASLTKGDCERCQGNGEIVTDWDRYLHPLTDDIGDEAVASCPDCNGYGSDHERDAAIKGNPDNGE